MVTNVTDKKGKSRLFMKKRLIISLVIVAVAVFGYSMQASACHFTNVSIVADCVEDGSGGYSIDYAITAITDSGVMDVKYSLTISGVGTVSGSFESNGAPLAGSQPVPDCGDYTLTGSVTLVATGQVVDFGPKDVTCSSPGDEGCTPGFWKNHLDAWEATGYYPDDIFDSVFSVSLFGPDFTLENAVWARGGGNNKLARHGTAALLNADHIEVDYPLTVDGVIAAVQAGDTEILANFNEFGTPGFCD